MTDIREGGFCTSCGFEVSAFEELNKCPSCETKGLPCSWKNQIDVNINWHELKLLATWAEMHWNNSIKDSPSYDGEPNVVYTIVERLRKQHPELASSNPLTLAGDVQQVVDKFGDVEHNIPGVEGGFNPDLGKPNNGS